MHNDNVIVPVNHNVNAQNPAVNGNDRFGYSRKFNAFVNALQINNANIDEAFDQFVTCRIALLTLRNALVSDRNELNDKLENNRRGLQVWKDLIFAGGSIAGIILNYFASDSAKSIIGYAGFGSTILAIAFGYFFSEAPYLNCLVSVNESITLAELSIRNNDVILRNWINANGNQETAAQRRAQFDNVATPLLTPDNPNYGPRRELFTQHFSQSVLRVASAFNDLIFGCGTCRPNRNPGWFNLYVSEQTLQERRWTSSIPRNAQEARGFAHGV